MHIWNGILYPSDYFEMSYNIEHTIFYSCNNDIVYFLGFDFFIVSCIKLLATSVF